MQQQVTGWTVKRVIDTPLFKYSLMNVKSGAHVLFIHDKLIDVAPGRR